MTHANPKALTKCAYPEALKEEEQTLIQARRKKADIQSDKPLVGIALSGGGIRSATFALGVLQGMAKRRALRYVDFLSTVSGGGYIGGFLGSLLCRGADDGQALTINQVEEKISDSNSRYIRWLRANGFYLAPNGTSDFFNAFATSLRNLVSLHAVMGLMILSILLLTLVARIGFVTLSHSVMPSENDTVKHLLLGQEMATIGSETASFTFVASPLYVAAAAFFVIWVCPCIWAYWLIPIKNMNVWRQIRTLVALLVIGGATTYFYIASRRLDHTWIIDQPYEIITVTIASLIIIRALAGVISFILYHRYKSYNTVENPCHASEKSQVRANKWLSIGMGAVIVSLFVATADSFGQSTYDWLLAIEQQNRLATSAGGAGAIGALGALLVRMLKQIPSAAALAQSPLMKRLILWIVMGLFMGLLTIAAATISHAIVWLGADRMETTLIFQSMLGIDGQWGQFLWATVCLLFFALLAITTGRRMDFINRSSQSQLYTERLTRAYLGGTNAERIKASNNWVTEPFPNDDISMSHYTPHAQGGPLHLINVTLNETDNHQFGSKEPAAKGLSYCVGPCAISTAVRHHVFWTAQSSTTSLALSNCPDGHQSPMPDDSYHMFHRQPEQTALQAEQLSIGKWLAISGAAFSTGLGYRTTLAMSFIAGVLNVRLGHWWDSGINPGEHGRGKLRRMLGKVFKSQAYLTDECMGAFPGPADRYWYLSDGGHFENSALYELIRRQLPVMIVSEASTDSHYQFRDLGLLVRRARVELDADVSFLSSEDLNALFAHKEQPSWLVGVNHVAHAIDMHGPTGGAQGYACLAHIRYDISKKLPADQQQHGMIIVIKPTLQGYEPEDILAYKRLNPSFPHQITADQFFDPEQWESYRKLGNYMAADIFDNFDPAEWTYEVLYDIQ